MNESIISVRYSKALFALSHNKGIITVVRKDMEALVLLLNESPDLALFFQNPVLKPSKKIEIIQSIFGSLNVTSLSFINLLIKNRREEHLEAIARNFISACKKFEGIESAIFTTSVEVDDHTLQIVRELISKVLKSKVELVNAVDDRIIGGFILRVGDKQFDASVHTSLEKLKRKLLETAIH